MNRRLQFAVIGLGRFGSRVAEGLYQQGHDVIAVDVSREAVEENSDRVTAAICGDATRPDVLASIGASEMDTVIVAIGDDIEASVLVTGLLSQGGCKKIVARASTDLHARILEMIGAHEVIYPEREMAIRLVRSLASPTIRDYVPIEEDLEFVQMTVPPAFVGKSLGQLDLRRKYNVTVVAVHTTDAESGAAKTVVPTAEYVFLAQDTMWVVGHRHDLEKIEALS